MEWVECDFDFAGVATFDPEGLPKCTAEPRVADRASTLAALDAGLATLDDVFDTLANLLPLVDFPDIDLATAFF